MVVLEFLECSLDIASSFIVKVCSRFGHDAIAQPFPRHPLGCTVTWCCWARTVPASFSLPNNSVRPCII
jgi:hypothetical protein